jgi:hypothetical protein
LTSSCVSRDLGLEKPLILNSTIKQGSELSYSTQYKYGYRHKYRKGARQRFGRLIRGPQACPMVIYIGLIYQTQAEGPDMDSYSPCLLYMNDSNNESFPPFCWRSFADNHLGNWPHTDI